MTTSKSFVSVSKRSQSVGFSVFGSRAMYDLVQVHITLVQRKTYSNIEFFSNSEIRPKLFDRFSTVKSKYDAFPDWIMCAFPRVGACFNRNRMIQ